MKISFSFGPIICEVKAWTEEKSLHGTDVNAQLDNDMNKPDCQVMYRADMIWGECFKAYDRACDLTVLSVEFIRTSAQSREFSFLFVKSCAQSAKLR